MMYRFRALAKQRDPDELDSPVVLASPRGWVAVFVCLFAVVAVISWGIAGRLPMSVDCSGSLVNPGGTMGISSNVSGTVAEVLAKPGDVIDKGDAIATIITGNGHEQKVEAPSKGRVTSLSLSEGGFLQQGAEVAVLEKDWKPNQRLVAEVLVPASDISRVEPGQEVLLSVSGVNPRQFGMLVGHVRNVAPFPIEQAGTGAEVPPTLVTIELDERSSTQSGYAWTSTSGPPQPLHTQTEVQAEIRLGTVAPISLLFQG